MVKPEPVGVLEAVERAFGLGRREDDQVIVATDFVLELTPSQKRQLERDRAEVRDRLLAQG